MVGTFIKQFKGKDLSKVPVSKLDKKAIWFTGLKYDGNYIQIHKKNDSVLMFSSKGIPFVYEEIAHSLLSIPEDFIIEAEFNNCVTGTKLNDRRLASTGTARANFKKGIKTNAPDSIIHVFDVLHFDGVDTRDMYFKNRVKILSNFNLGIYVNAVEFNPLSFENAIELSMDFIRCDGEGAFAFHELHTIKKNVNTERSNMAIKLKASKSAIMKCVGYVPSQTVIGEYGSFILEDNDGRKQAFGGLTKELRNVFGPNQIGNMFLVKYESFTKGKYVQGFITKEIK